MRYRLPTTIAAALLLLAAVTITGCASTVCSGVTDKATCQVTYYLSIADQVDTNLQALKAGVPALSPSVVHAIDAYHTALPAAEQAARDGLAAYLAGQAKDYTTVMQYLINLYTDINKVVMAAGEPNQVAAATARVSP